MKLNRSDFELVRTILESLDFQLVYWNVAESRVRFRHKMADQDVFRLYTIDYSNRVLFCNYFGVSLTPGLTQSSVTLEEFVPPQFDVLGSSKYGRITNVSELCDRIVRFSTIIVRGACAKRVTRLRNSTELIRRSATFYLTHKMPVACTQAQFRLELPRASMWQLLSFEVGKNVKYSSATFSDGRQTVTDEEVLGVYRRVLLGINDLRSEAKAEELLIIDDHFDDSPRRLQLHGLIQILVSKVIGESW